MADAIGLIVLALLVSGCAALVPAATLPAPMCIYLYAVLAACGLFAWRKEGGPHGPAQWLLLVPGCALLGALFFGVDLLIGHLHHPESPLLAAAWQTGGLFGLGLTVMLVPASFVALAGAARSFYLDRRRAES